ncbi:hypothetical protein [Amycolatopsis sp.]|uniref:hypothetical protein n=1 Tax=Amycolatopsis sp. TaxID=37632 RepID=UPI002DF8CDF0|nr:hypothetical protein [Amycolatopsis sp.]
MNARIMIDLTAVHPVTNGRWHRVANLHRMPRPGEQLIMMCGESEPAEFVAAGPIIETAPTTCWRCDLAYRRAAGIPVRPDHPALPVPRPRPHA